MVRVQATRIASTAQSYEDDGMENLNVAKGCLAMLHGDTDKALDFFRQVTLVLNAQPWPCSGVSTRARRAGPAALAVEGGWYPSQASEYSSSKNIAAILGRACALCARRPPPRRPSAQSLRV